MIFMSPWPQLKCWSQLSAVVVDTPFAVWLMIWSFFYIRCSLPSQVNFKLLGIHNMYNGKTQFLKNYHIFLVSASQILDTRMLFTLSASPKRGKTLMAQTENWEFRELVCTHWEPPTLTRFLLKTFLMRMTEGLLEKSELCFLLHYNRLATLWGVFKSVGAS